MSTKLLVRAGMRAILGLKTAGSTIHVDQKAEGDFASTEDLVSDHAMSSLARSLYQDIEIFSEESCPCGDNLPSHCVLIDPLDGSNSRLRRRDAWGIYAVIMKNYYPMEATAFSSWHGRRFVFHAKAGQGLYLYSFRRRNWKRFFLKKNFDGTRISVPGSPKAASTDLALSYQKYLDEHSLWRSSVCEGCALGNMTALLMNSIDVYVNAATGSALDIAALQLFIKEAGGFVCDHEGKYPEWRVSWQPVILARRKEFAQKFIMRE